MKKLHLIIVLLGLCVTAEAQYVPRPATGGVATTDIDTTTEINALTTDDDFPTLTANNIFTGANTNSKSGAASVSAMKYSGVPFAGTGTTSFPLLYVNDANATASTTLNTAGTYFGVNGDGTQDLMNLLKDGASLFKVGSTGLVNVSGPSSANVITLQQGSTDILALSTSKGLITVNGRGGEYNDGASLAVPGNMKIRLVPAAPGGMYLASDEMVGFTSAISVSGSPDTYVTRGTVGVLSFGDGTTPQTWRSVPAAPSQITANQNNYNPASSSYYQRWNTDASRNITGMTFTATQVDGQTHVVTNVGAQNIVIVNESASSTAANRFHNSTGADITLAADGEVNCWYDATTARWRVTKRGF